MARKPASGLELSFKKDKQHGGGYWYKKYKDHRGKWVPKHFGWGKGVSDRKSYREALTRHKRWQQIENIVGGYLQMQKGLISNGLASAAAGNDQTLEMIINHLPTETDKTSLADSLDNLNLIKNLKELAASGFAFDAGLSTQLRYADESAERKANPKKGKTVAALVEKWLQAEELRVKTKKISASSLRDKRQGIKLFLEHVNGDSFNGNVNDMLMSYRAKLDMRLAGGEIAGWTHRGFTKFAWQFIDWCWRQSHIKDMPRCKKDFCELVPINKGGQPIDLDDINKLWSAAGNRMKCFIAIALNTGMKNGDIAALKGSNLVGDRLIGYRPKTKVPFNVKLWPVTQQLIAAERDTQGNNEYLFTNSTGGAVASGTMSSLFKKVSIRAGVIVGKTKGGNDKGATFEQLRDTSAEHVRKLLREDGGDLGLLQVFLQHSDRSTAAYYTSDRAEELQSDKLDKATDKLSELYGLKL